MDAVLRLQFPGGGKGGVDGREKADEGRKVSNKRTLDATTSFLLSHISLSSVILSAREVSYSLGGLDSLPG